MAVNPELAKALTKDWERLQDQRFRRNGGWESQALMSIAFSKGQQNAFYERGIIATGSDNPNQPNISYNMIKRNVRRIDGKVGAIIPDFHAVPGTADPIAVAVAKVESKLIRALDDELSEPTLARQRRWWMWHTGLVYEHISYREFPVQEEVPLDDGEGGTMWTMVDDESVEFTEAEAKEMVDSGQADKNTIKVKVVMSNDGEIVSEIVSPFNVFCDSTVKSIKELQPDQWVHIVQPKTMDWVRAQTQWEGSQESTLDKSGDLSVIRSKIQHNTSSLTGFNLFDILPIVQGYQDPEGPGIMLLAQSYQPSSKEYPKGRYVVWAPRQDVILHDGEIPYEKYEYDYQIPLVDFHFEPVTTSHHTFGVVSDAIPPQIVLNKRANQAAKYVNGNLSEPYLFDNEALMEQWRPDEPHGIKDAFSPEGRPLVSRVASGGVPASLFKLLEMADQKIDQVMGIRDLFENNQLPGQIRGSTAFERIEEISGLEWQALIRDYFSQLAMVKAKRNNRVRQFYTKDKMFAFVSRTGEDEVLEWKRDEQRDHQHRITIVPSSLTPEIRSMREDRIREQLNTPGMGMALYGNADRTDYDPSKLAQAMGMPEGEYRERAARERTLQSQENEEMEHGNQVPVYPGDDDSIHMDEMRTSMCDMGWRKKNSPETPVYEAYKAHLAAHSEQFANKNEAATTAEAAVTAQEMFRASMAQLMPQIIQQIGDMAAAQFEQVAGNSPGGPIAALQALDASAEGGDEYEQ